MARIELKGVHTVAVKGRLYHYAWRGRGAPRLLSEPGSPQFVEELAAAIATRQGGDQSRLSGLVARYLASDEWRGLSDKTRANWDPWIARIRDHFGELRLAQFDRPVMTGEIRRWRNGWKATPRYADMALQAFSRLLSFGQADGRLSTNAVTPIPRLYAGDRSEIIWTDEDLAALRKVAPKEVMWVADLASLTGLRQGDLMRLAWSHVSKNAIEIRTSKNGRTALIPMHAALRRLLKTIPKRATTVLTNSDRRPWKSFGSSWQRAVKATKVGKHFHDLRGTAATRLYGAGLSIREIAGVMAWSEKHVEAILDRYVKRDELLRDRIRRMDAAAKGKDR